VQFWQNELPRKNEWSQRWAKTAAESHGAGLGIPNSLFGRNNSLFRERTGNRLQTVEIA